MPQVPCKECGENIASDDKTCPRCGADLSKTPTYIWLIAAIVVAVIAAPFVFLSFEPEQTDEEKAVLLEQIEAENRRVRLLQEEQLGGEKTTIN
jgi:hypothetical protein